MRSRILEERHSGIAHKTYLFSLLQVLDDARGLFFLIKPVVADEAGSNLKAGKEHAGDAGVFGKEIVHFGKRIKSSLRDIAQVADRCCNKVKHIHHSEFRERELIRNIGGTQIRTGDKGFAGPCLTAWLCRRSAQLWGTRGDTVNDFIRRRSSLLFERGDGPAQVLSGDMSCLENG